MEVRGVGGGTRLVACGLECTGIDKMSGSPQTLLHKVVST